MKAYIEAMRGLAYLDAAAVDAESHHPDPDGRAAAGERSAILTPITKAWCTDLGVELTSLAVQVHGGMGFVEETGVAQHMRDARINPIYEGTNGIQALDLVARKLPMRGGGAIADLLDDVAATAAAAKGMDGPLGSMGLSLAVAETSVRETTTTVLEYMNGAPVEAFAGATPYLKMLGQLLGAWTLVGQAQAAQRRLDRRRGRRTPRCQTHYRRVLLHPAAPARTRSGASSDCGSREPDGADARTVRGVTSQMPKIGMAAPASGLPVACQWC